MRFWRSLRGFLRCFWLKETSRNLAALLLHLRRWGPAWCSWRSNPVLRHHTLNTLSHLIFLPDEQFGRSYFHTDLMKNHVVDVADVVNFIQMWRGRLAGLALWGGAEVRYKHLDMRVQKRHLEEALFWYLEAIFLLCNFFCFKLIFSVVISRDWWALVHIMRASAEAEVYQREIITGLPAPLVADSTIPSACVRSQCCRAEPPRFGLFELWGKTTAG